jgi:hypothetical protein
MKVTISIVDDEFVLEAPGQRMRLALSEPHRVADCVRHLMKIAEVSRREAELAQAKWDAALRRSMDVRRATHDARVARDRARLEKKSARRDVSRMGRDAVKLLEECGLI